MSSENKFKDALNEKLGAKEFQFDEANWEKARAMIDASREEKTRKPFPFFIIGGLLLLITATCLYLFKQTNLFSTKIVSTTAYKNKVQETKHITASDKLSETSFETNKLNKSPGKITSAVPKNENYEIAKATSYQVKEATNKTFSKNNSNKASVAAIPEQEKNTALKNGISHEAKEKTLDQVIIHKNEGSETTTIFQKNKEELVKIDSQKNITVSDFGQIQQIKDSLVAQNKVDTLPKTITSSKKDSLPAKIVTEPLNYIAIEAGTNYLFGWNNPTKKDANGFNPVIGINYSNIITKQLTLSVGVHYAMVRNLSYSNYVVKTTRYKFGEESDVMVFTPTTMHYLVAPLRLSYALSTKNSFGIACNIGYLFNLNSNVELYHQQAGQKSASTILKTSGYTKGFKTFDTQIALFYRRKLSNDFYLHTEFMYGLTDIKDNTFYKSATNERNVGLKLTLVYNLFKK